MIHFIFMNMMAWEKILLSIVAFVTIISFNYNFVIELQFKTNPCDLPFSEDLDTSMKNRTFP